MLDSHIQSENWIGASFGASETPLHRPEIQFAVVRLLSDVSAPQEQHWAVLNTSEDTAPSDRYVYGSSSTKMRVNSSWNHQSMRMGFRQRIRVSRKSVDVVHEFMGTRLVEVSSASQRLVAFPRRASSMPSSWVRHHCCSWRRC